MTDTVKTLAESMPVRAMAIETVADFMLRVWVQSCRAFRIYPGRTRVKVESGRLVPHGFYTVTRHANVGRAAWDVDPRLDLRECRLSTDKRKPKDFPRVPLSCCRVLPHWEAAFDADEWRAAGETLLLPGFAGRGLGGAGLWPVLADRIQDCYSGADTGWPPFAPYTSDLLGSVLRELAAAGLQAAAPVAIAEVERFNQWPKDRY